LTQHQHPENRKPNVKNTTQLQTDAGRLIRAAFPAFNVTSPEPEEAERELAALCAREKWLYARWTMATGLTVHPPGEEPRALPDINETDAINALPAMMRDFPDTERALASFRHVLPLAMTDPTLRSAIEHAAERGKTAGYTLAFVGTSATVHPEIQRHVTALRHDLPSVAELEAIATQTDDPDNPADPATIASVAAAARGLTRAEAENAFALALVTEGRLSRDPITSLKRDSIERGGLLKIARTTERFQDLGGLDALKDFTRDCILTNHPGAKPRGTLLLGVPGTGKSSFARALGNETQRPVIRLDVGALMGSLVGQTEEQTRRALDTIEAVGECILFIDEVEKALSGAGGGGEHDSGVGSRLLGTLLTWLAEHTAPVYTVATSNDIRHLHEALFRAGRFDAIFFLDYPSPAQKEAIWQLYLERYGLTDAKRPDDTAWTGAEIESACKLAAMTGRPLDRAARLVVPVAQTAREKIEALRQWADGRALDPEEPDTIYTSRSKPSATDAPARRRAPIKNA
jgi:hypothetical protein